MDIYGYANAHEKLLEQIPNFVGLSTLDNMYAFVNNKTAKALGFQSSHDLAGVSFSNVRCKAAEDAKFFEKENNLVVNQLKKISVLGYHRYINDWTLILCEKSPLMNPDGKLIGVLSYFIDITNYNLVDYSRFVFNLEKKIKPSNKESFSYLIEDGTVNCFKLSERQIECLFFLLRGQSDKEIGSILSLSPRTIESYINEIKFKMNCLTRTQVVEKSFSEGLFNLIPKSLIRNVA